MTPKRKTILIRFLRAAGAVLIAAIVGFVTGPDFVELLPAPWNGIAASVLVPALLAADKFRRYGNDPGENAG